MELNNCETKRNGSVQQDPIKIKTVEY